jgi:hypothetical protein
MLLDILVFLLTYRIVQVYINREVQHHDAGYLSVSSDKNNIVQVCINGE